MPEVIMLANISGTRDGEAWPPRGASVDLPDSEAADAVASGIAAYPADVDLPTVAGQTPVHPGPLGVIVEPAVVVQPDLATPATVVPVSVNAIGTDGKKVADSTSLESHDVDDTQENGEPEPAKSRARGAKAKAETATAAKAEER